MKKVILLMISLFICMVAIGQDDMYIQTQKPNTIETNFPKGAEANGKIELDVYDFSGKRIYPYPYENGYRGVALIVIKADGKRYVIKCEFTDDEDNLANIANEILSIYNKIIEERKQY